MDDEKYYQAVAEELRANRINDALWTKAIARSLGDENKTKAMYIQLRVDQLMQQEKRGLLAGEAAGGGEDAEVEAAADAPPPPDANPVAVTGKLVAVVILTAVIIWAVKNLLWPKLQSYL